MPRIKSHKPIIIILVVLLLVLSISVMLAPDMKSIKSVRVKNQNIVINQETPNVAHTNVGLNHSANQITNENMDSLNRGINLNNSDVNFGSGNQSGSDMKNNVGNRNIKFSNIDNNPNRLSFQYSPNYRRQMEAYRYQNIDWGEWKSRFVNRILDDSLFIKSLDTYGIGTWFYYSFTVTNTGEIHDVTVFSLYLTDEDKMNIRALIRSYEQMPITIFPKDSQRKKAKIKAVMLLGDTEQKAKSSNFTDIEKIKIKY